MPIGGKIGDENGVAQILIDGYIGDENGIAQKVVKAYIGDENGIAQLCYTRTLNNINITGLTGNIYCVVDGVTYKDGDVSLQLPTGTPIDIYMRVGSMYNSIVDINGSGMLQNCEKFRYMVIGDASIDCTTNSISTVVSVKAAITEATPKTGCFKIETRTLIDGVVVYNYFGYAFRNGMNWRTFIESMYNDGLFMLNGNNVSYKVMSINVLMPSTPNDDGGYPVNATDTIINLQRYI